MPETRIGISEFRRRLSQFLRKVKAGETIIITERGKPVGQIVPIQADLPDRLAKLAEAGLVEWNVQPVQPYQPKAVNQSKHLLSDLISQERE